MSASAPRSVIERTKAAMRPSSPRSSRISSTTARYSRSSSRIPSSVGLLVGALLDLDEQPSLGVGRCGARDAAMQAVEGNSETAAREPDSIGDLGDRSDLRVPVVVLGHEQHTLFVADVDGEGDVHVREDDEVVQRDEQQAHRVLGHGSRFRTFAVVGSETVPTAGRSASRPVIPRCVEAARA